MKHLMNKVLAYVCAIALIVAGMTGYQTRNVEAADITVDGVTYTVGDATGNYVGFICQGAFDGMRFGFAWSGDVTQASSTAAVTIQKDGVVVKDLGTKGNGMSLYAEDLAGIAAGTYTIVFTGTGDFASQSSSVPLTISGEVQTTAPIVVTDGAEMLNGVTFTDADTTTDESSTEPLWMELSQNNVAVYTNNGDGSVSVSVPAYESGDNWATQLKQNQIQLIKDKWYTAKFTVTSDVDKKIQLLIQHNVDWSVFAEKITAVAAGTTEEVEITFPATQTTNKVLFGIMMGYVDDTASEAANVTISNVSLKGYNANPNGDAEVTTTETPTAKPAETTTVTPTETITAKPAETTTVTPTETTTVAPVETTTVTTSTKLPKPEGLVNSPAEDGTLKYNFAWQKVENAVSYNIYINKEFIAPSTTLSYNAAEYFETAEAGIYTIEVAGVDSKGREGEKASITYEVKVEETTTTSAQIETTTKEPVETPTELPSETTSTQVETTSTQIETTTTTEPTTTAPATPSISEVKAESPNSKTIDVEWSVANEDSNATYIVYLGDKEVAKDIKEKKYTISDLKPGKYQVKVVAVLDGKEISSKTVEVSVNISLIVKKSGKTYKYALGSDSSYTLSKKHKDFVKKYPDLISKGYVFKGFYKNNKKVTKITEDTEVIIKWRTVKTKLKKIKLVKGNVKLFFNKKDWKNIDGFKITYSMNKKFKKKKSKSIFVKTNGKVKKTHIIKKSSKKFKNGGGYYFKIQFYYKNGKKKVYYVGNNKGTLAYRKK